MKSISMKKMIALALAFMLCLLAVSCSGTDAAGDNAAAKEEMINMTLKINDEEVNVVWEDNESVRALAELASASPLTIEASAYGGFEQVGPIGTTLPKDDKETTTVPGDIMLYTGSNIVIFYGSNSWAYTALGHIEGKSADELAGLLGGSSTVLTITAE